MDIFDYDKKCIDPIAQAIILASIDYVVSTTQAVAMSTTQGTPKMDTIRDLRNSVFRMPKCELKGRPAPPPPPSPTTQVIKYTEPTSQTRTKRTLAPLWGKPTYQGPGALKGQEFSSLGELATRLGFTTEGADSQIIGFQRAGFEVKSADGPLEKGKNLVVTKIPGVEIPRQFRIEIPEVRTSPTAKEPEIPKKIGPPRVPVYKMEDGKKVLVKWQDEHGRDVPKEFWPQVKNPEEVALEQAIAAIPEGPARDAFIKKIEDLKKQAKK